MKPLDLFFFYNIYLKSIWLPKLLHINLIFGAWIDPFPFIPPDTFALFRVKQLGFRTVDHFSITVGRFTYPIASGIPEVANGFIHITGTASGLVIFMGIAGQDRGTEASQNCKADN